MTDDARADLRPVLEAYRRAKWAELHDSGIDRLVRELWRLEEFLERVDRGERPEDFSREVEVDVEFRRAKAAILREVLAEARAKS